MGSGFDLDLIIISRIEGLVEFIVENFLQPEDFPEFLFGRRKSAHLRAQSVGGRRSAQLILFEFLRRKDASQLGLLLFLDSFELLLIFIEHDAFAIGIHLALQVVVLALQFQDFLALLVGKKTIDPLLFVIRVPIFGQFRLQVHAQ